MVIIIDGYNLLKQITKQVFVTEAERTRFISQLGTYAHSQKHEVYIVFDGGPYIRPTKIAYKHVTVIYSGQNQSADDYIKNYIAQVRTKDILVVSTDRKITSFAKQHGIITVDSLDFYQVITRLREKNNITVAQSSGQARKLSDVENPELDALMQETRRVIYKQEDQENNLRDKTGNPQQISKKAKKLLKIVKKL